MTEYLSPGVYIEEFEIGARPIEGVSTSIGGFLGETERGPVKPRPVISWLDFRNKYGGHFTIDGTQFLPYAVEGFFINGGKTCYIGRITRENAKEAEVSLSGQIEAMNVSAAGGGEWGNNIAVRVDKGTGSGFRLTVYYWQKPTRPIPLERTEFQKFLQDDPPSQQEVFDNVSIVSGSPDYYRTKIRSRFVALNAIATPDLLPGDAFPLVRLGRDSGTLYAEVPNALTIKTIGPVGPGNRVAVMVKTGSLSKQEPKTYFRLQVMYWSTPVDDADRPTNADNLKSFLKGNPPDLFEDFDNLSMDPESPDYYATKVISDIIEIPPGTSQQIPVNTETCIFLRGGSDGLGLPDKSRYANPGTNDPGKRGGLEAFAEIHEISIVYAPDATKTDGLVEMIIEHCETLKDRFAIIDSKKGQNDISNLKPRHAWPTKYAAFYYPWITINDPVNGTRKTIPPGGYIAGIYARSDTERGVHKAPANEDVRGAVGLEFPITKGVQGLLNPRGVNCIREFPGRGIRVWGARTLSDNSLWKYVNVRRLFNYLEESIEEGCRWVVFEPNDEKLWARVRATITQFLTDSWRSGALMGKKPEEAFFVKCDRSTMSQGDIDNGRLVCVIGIAPVKPAEFVIFRIVQWQGGSAVTE